MRNRKWTLREQAEFLKRAGELLHRGYPLAEAIHSLTYQMKKTRQEEIGKALMDLKEGFPFHKILLNLGFHQTLVGFVYFAEQHGSLAEAFQDGSEMILRRDSDTQKLKKIIVYPIVLIVITICLFVFVEKVLLPQYTSLFQSMSIPPNIFMKFVFFVGEVFPLILFLFILALLFGLGFYILKYQRLSPIIQKTLLSTIPLTGSFFRLYTTYYFAIQLSYLLRGGMSISEAVMLFEEHERHAFDRCLGSDLREHLSTGETFEDVLKRYRFFEKEFPLIVKHGQENGKLEQELQFFGKYCLGKLENKTEKLFKIIQPLLFSFIGIIIVSMYLAILLPMFQLLDGF